jgi:hypothetical protein
MGKARFKLCSLPSTSGESVASSKRNLIFKCHSQLRVLSVMEREPTVEAEAAP